MMLLALPAALGYAFSALFIKLALQRGASGRWVNSAVNLLSALVFQLILCFERSPIPWHDIWQPLLAGTVFWLGQSFLFRALSGGDVGVAAPLLGVKTVFVVFLISLLTLSAPVGPEWLAAGTCAVGIFLIGGGRLQRLLRWGNGGVILAALASAFCFALSDALLQIWSRSFGAGAFVALMFGWSGLVSVGGWLLDRAPCPPRAAWRPLAIGGGLMVAQSFTFCLAIVLSGDAAGSNILYALRAVFSVLVVTLMGKSLGLHEAVHLGAAHRLAGAGLIFLAVVIILYP